MTKQHLNLKLRVEKNLVARERPSRRVVEIRLQAPKLINPVTERIPLNLALVIDRSGSMSGDKIDYVKQAAKHVIGLLKEEDRAAVYIYDDEIDCIMPNVRLTENNRQRCLSAIDEVSARGMTNLSGGWLAGCEAVAEHLDDETINRVLLLSDGLANKGITSHSKLGEHAAEINNRGVTTSTFGVGLDFSEHLLELMANQGGGNFYYIEAPSQIQEIFLQELEELLHVSVKDVELQLSLPDRGSSFDILGGWQHTAEENTVNIHIGDLAEHQERAVYLIATVPDSDELSTVPLKIALTALDENGDEIKQETEVTFSYATLEECEAAPYDQELMERYSRVHLSDTTREALILERQGKHKQASEMLDKAIHETAAYMPMAAMEAFEERRDKMEQGLSERARKRMHYNTYRASRTRNNGDELKEE